MTQTQVTTKEVNDFSEHCVFVYSVYLYLMRLYRDSDESERNTINAVARWFFDDLGKVFREFVIVAACKITDPARDSKGNENFTVEMFANRFGQKPDTFKKLDGLRQSMKKLRDKILPARNKLGSHTDYLAVVTGQILGQATDKEWSDFWSALAEFVSLLNEEVVGSPYQIDAAGVPGDADNLLKALKQSQWFEALLNGTDPKVEEACLKVAFPDTD